MRIPYEELRALFEEILLAHGVSAENAAPCAENFAQSSLDGIYSHGVNRFPHLIEYLDKGLVDGKARPVCVASAGAMERWDGRLGLGNVNARLAMDRACDLAREHGIGAVALANTNHWMRGGAYGWQAAGRGCVGICWTNTMPNTPVWGGVEAKIGNNPFVIGIPRSDGRHIVLDCAMTQFAFGKIEMARMKGERLPVPGGYDTRGELTDDPAEIERTGRALTIGYWKGSGLALVLDLAAAMLSGGSTTTDIGRRRAEETGVSQMMIAMDPGRFQPPRAGDEMIERVLADITAATPTGEGGIRYPAQREYATRADNLQKGIPVLEEVWAQIQALRPGTP